MLYAIENIALRICQILYTFVLRVEKNFSRTTENLLTSQSYIFYSLRHFTTKLCNFTKFRMLIQAVVIFFPISIFFKISSKRLKVQLASLPPKPINSQLASCNKSVVFVYVCGLLRKSYVHTYVHAL